MGRGKIEIKRIENSNSRQVTFSKRKKGLFKKAEEISILCDAKVLLIVYSPNTGKMHDFCSSNTSVSFILEEYHKITPGQKLWDAKHENLSREIDRVIKENENMDVELRHMKAQEIQSLNYRELIVLENTLENGLTSVRAAQMDCVNQLRQNGEILESENKRLTYELMEMHGGVRDYNTHNMPFAFRVQPMQPNLQERM